MPYLSIYKQKLFIIHLTSFSHNDKFIIIIGILFFNINKEVFMFDKIIETAKNDMVQTVCDLIQFQSISTEKNNPALPFGEECKKALDYTLDLAEKLGFRTKNLDGYCGYIEFGEGEEMVGIIGHLDVVPAKLEDGWSSSPFDAVIHDNKIYGRGSIDDKGPVVASLYAMKAILDSGKKINKHLPLALVQMLIFLAFMLKKVCYLFVLHIHFRLKIRKFWILIATKML